MILTLTPNPSLDLLFGADRLVWDDANRLPMPRRRAGGQGLNVVRAARALAPESDVLAVAPLGGPVGRELQERMADEGTPLDAVPIAGETRVFVGVRERATGRALLLNPRGPAADPELAERLLAAVAAALPAALPADPVGRAGTPWPGKAGGWVVGCGSLLPGLPADLYARIGRLARERGARFVPDCDGEALARAVEAGADLLVPNTHEAARLVGRSVVGPRDAVEAALELLGRGPERVAITLGEEGAVAGDGSGAWWARPALPPGLTAEAEEGSAVGAGDAFLAALLLALDGGRPLQDALADAVAAGTATLLSRGSDLVRPEDVARVRPHVRLEPLN